MPLLIRKVNPTKWEKGQDGVGNDEIPADAITADLRTEGNRLSFWRCESANAESLDKAALPLASNAENRSRMDFAYLDVDEVANNGLVMKESPGKTKAACTANDHVEIVNLDLSRLGKLAEMIHTSIHINKPHKIPAGKMVKLVARAVEDGKVPLEKLNENLRKRVEKALEN